MTAREFSADPRKRGYRTANISLYYTRLRTFLNFLELKLQLKIRKSQVRPPVYDLGDIERSLREAIRGMTP